MEVSRNQSNDLFTLKIISKVKHYCIVWYHQGQYQKKNAISDDLKTFNNTKLFINSLCIQTRVTLITICLLNKKYVLTRNDRNK